MANPFYSIIIPTYNSKQHIDKCLLSIRNQQFSDLELIIQDGGSTDGTLDQVRLFASENPGSHIQIFSEPDKGIYDAMNKAIAKSSGAWVLFLGSDDQLYADDVLARVAVSLQRTNANLVYGNAMLDGKSKWAANTFIYDGAFSVEKLFEKNICHQSIFYNRKVFETVGIFNTQYPVCADWDFNLRCFAKTPVEYVDQVIARFSAEGLSNTGNDNFRDDSIFLLKEYFAIGYFNNLFQYHSWTFLHHSILRFKERKFTGSLYFLMLSFYHAKNKFFFCKVVLSKLLKPHRGGHHE